MGFSTGAYKSQAAYPLYELKPERTESWEVGLTARFLKYFNFDVSFYNTKTYNQTVDAQLSPTGGYNKFYAQTGEVRNRGVELSLEFKNTWNKFTWNSNYTFSANKNKILSLIDGYVNPVTGETISKERLEVGGLANAKFLLKVGGSLGDLYSVKDLVRDSNNNIYVDEEGKVAINERLATSSWVRYFRKPIWLGVTISNTVTGAGLLADCPLRWCGLFSYTGCVRLLRCI